MSTRKNIRPKIRYEVFKRDGFKCQYCGRSAPDVVLEVDHIRPVADDGDNDLMNLITSCFECNRGKGKRRLDDNAEVLKQKKELELLNEKREQMEMMLKWRKELREQADILLKKSIFEIEFDVGVHLNNEQIAKIEEYLDEYGFKSVSENSHIVGIRYRQNKYSSVDGAIKSIGHLCYKEKNERSKINGINIYANAREAHYLRARYGIDLYYGMKLSEIIRCIEVAHGERGEW